MRSTHSNAPVAAMAVIGFVALLILGAAILTLYMLGPRPPVEPAFPLTATRESRTPTLPPVEATTPARSNTPVPAPTNTATRPPNPTPTPTSLPTRTAVPATRRPTATPVPPTRTPAPPTRTPSPTPAFTVNLFFVALGDNGASGLPLGCGDSLVRIPRTLPTPPTLAERIAAALTALFAVQDQYVGEQRYFNALYQSDLVVNSVAVEGSTAIVRLSGTLERGDDCNRPRLEAQIEGTISDFAEIDAVQVYVNGTPLETLLYGDR